VLAEQQEVGGETAREAVLGEATLESEGVGVGDGAEVADRQRERGQGSGVSG